MNKKQGWVGGQCNQGGGGTGTSQSEIPWHVCKKGKCPSNERLNQIKTQTKINHFSLTVFSDRNGYAVFCKRHITDYRQRHRRHPKFTEKSGEKLNLANVCVW